MNRYAPSHSLISALGLAGFMLFCAACGGEDHELTAADDGCEHMIEGPSAALSATGDDQGEAPDMVERHVRYDITLAGDAAPYSGYVDLVMDEAGEFVIFFDQPVSLTVLDSSGADVPPEVINTNVTECIEVSAGYTFDLGVGTYRLGLGPSDEPLVRVVVVDGAEHGHE